MEKLRNTVNKMLTDKKAALFIGYEEADENTSRALFMSKPEDTDRLILDNRCIQNIALYLKKKELKKLGRIGIVAPIHVIRSLLQMASENQIKEKDIIVLTKSPDGSIVEFSGFADMEKYVAVNLDEIPEADLKTIIKLEAMTPEERMKFWMGQFSKCVKCYACRAACPMCYCGRCQVEYNQPQIITVEATPLGNLEWHFMRAMHLAGRCVNCGECGRSCPVGIPVHLLSFKTCLTVKERFDATSGVNSDLKSVMSNFKVDDKENFIK